MAADPVLIYGAGAIGALIGGRLAAAGAPVTLLGRARLREASAAHGLRLELPGAQLQLALPVVTGLEAIAVAPAFTLVTLKAYDIEAALPDLAELAGAGSTLVTLQNGVGSEELVQPVAPRLIAGSFTLRADSPESGVVRQETAKGGLALAAVQGNPGLAPLVELLESAGLRAPVVRDYRALKWSKLLLNLLGNASAALLNRPPATIFADPALFALERAGFLEALAVMHGLGLRPLALPGFGVPLLTRAMRLPAPLARRLIAPRIARGRGDKLPSLLLDVRAGRGRTEVRWLNGAVVRAGAELSIPTPVNARLTELVEIVTADPARREALAGNPAALLGAAGSAG